MSLHPDDPALLDEQLAYYRARAPEYDDWWLRRNAFDLGEDHGARWEADIAELRGALAAFGPRGRVLELAAGTGGWTVELARHADEITAIDASAETLTINRTKTSGAGTPIRYVEADLFAWRPDRRYDVVFFSFWLTHVPPARFGAFFALVADALDPAGRFFVIDNAPPRQPRTDEGGGISRRRLYDGREFDIVKVYWEPDALASRLASMGWRADIRQTAQFFIYGSGEMASD